MELLAFFDDADVPSGEANLVTKLGPLHSIMDAELTGIRFSLAHLVNRTD